MVLEFSVEDHSDRFLCNTVPLNITQKLRLLSKRDYISCLQSQFCQLEVSTPRPTSHQTCMTLLQVEGPPGGRTHIARWGSALPNPMVGCLATRHSLMTPPLRLAPGWGSNDQSRRGTSTFFNIHKSQLNCRWSGRSSRTTQQWDTPPCPRSYVVWGIGPGRVLLISVLILLGNSPDYFQLCSCLYIALSFLSCSLVPASAPVALVLALASSIPVSVSTVPVSSVAVLIVHHLDVYVSCSLLLILSLLQFSLWSMFWIFLAWQLFRFKMKGLDYSRFPPFLHLDSLTPKT